MKKKAFIATLISTFSVVGLIFVLIITTIKDNYSNVVNYPGKTITISRVENGKVKNSSDAKVKSHAVGTINLNMPEISMEKKEINVRTTSNQSTVNEAVNLTPAPNYSLSKAKRNSSTLPSSSGNISRNISGGGSNVSMTPLALLDNSKNIVKTANSGFVSTTSDLTSPKTMANQKFNAGGSPPPSEKEPIHGSLPIGDGWNFLILLAVVYAGLKKWLL